MDMAPRSLADVHGGAVDVQRRDKMTIEYLDEPYTIEERPLWWHKQGLTQTASGYGSKLTSSRVVRLESGAVRRIYITCYSNVGSAWIMHHGRRLYLR